MPIADEIRALKESARDELNATHDYYWHSRKAWQIVQRSVKKGLDIKIKNSQTGTETTGKELSTKAADYIRVQIPEATFQQFLSIFEAFLADFLRLWLRTYPRSLGGDSKSGRDGKQGVIEGCKQVDFRTILDAPDKDAIIQVVIDRVLSEVTYGPPAVWFKYVEKIAGLGTPTSAEIEQFAEAKASRDVLVHNGGIVNETYVSKAGKQARYEIGKRIAIPNDYHKATWELIHKLVGDMCDAATNKIP